MARDEPPAPKHMQGVGDIVNLRQIGGDQDDPGSGLEQLGEKFVNFDFGTDVDTHGWFVENKKAGAMVQPFSDDDLLLISAGKTRRGSVARSRFDLHVPDLFIRGSGLSKRVNDDAGGQTLIDRKIDVESDSQIQAKTLITPAFGYKGDAEPDGVLFLADFDRVAVPENLPASLGEASKDALHELAASGADQAIESDDLAVPDPDGRLPRNLCPRDFRSEGSRAPKGIVSL